MEERKGGQMKGKKKEGRKDQKKEPTFSEGLEMVWVLRVHISTLLWGFLLSPIKICPEE